MTISSTNRKAGPYAGNDVAVSFPFAFKVFAAADVLVVFTSASNVETVLTLTTNYTVTLNSNQDTNPGGTVTLPTALATGEKLTLSSAVANLQPVDLTNNGGFYPAVINKALDRATIQIQQLAEKVGRALVWPISSSGATLPAPEASKFIGWNATADSLVNLSGVAVGDAQTVSFTQAGTGAVARNAQDKMRESVSVLDFTGVDPTGATDSTAGLQAAINHCATIKTELLFPAGSYLVTASLQLPIGSQLKGVKGDQYSNGFTIDPLATTINFQPTIVDSDLFVASGASYGGFRFHYSIVGFFFTSNTNSRYGINLDSVIYGNFENLSFADTFKTSINCNATINNRFCNVYTTGTVSAVNYAGNYETTDVWEQCSFWGAPIGVYFNRSSINIRFNSCLFEQLDFYGVLVAKDCQGITVVDAYAENVPYVNVPGVSMFSVGAIGTTLSEETQLIVIGGKYAGPNASLFGDFLQVDWSSGVSLIGVTHSRYEKIIETTAVTKANAVRVSGGGGIGWVTYANDYTKVSGTYPNSVNNGPSSALEARFPIVRTDSLIAADGNNSEINLAGGSIQLTPGSGNAIYPSSDEVVDLGIDSNVFKRVRGRNIQVTGAALIAPPPGVLQFGNDVGATASTGTNGAPPAQVAGYLIWFLGSAPINIPYYNV